jgi:tetratricopeptide (TPR) repeat protein
MKSISKTDNPNRIKRIIFIILAVSLPLILLIMLEFILILYDYGGDQSLFIEAGAPYKGYLKVNPEFSKRYFGRQSTLPKPANDVFLKEKPDNGYRIMVMGGSTALGFPYGNLLMFSRILHRRLQDTFPEKRIEVVNTALTAVNSWTLLDFIDEILAAEPDLILSYAGHNEYYGALGVASRESMGFSRIIIRLNLYLSRFRTVRMLRDGWRFLSSSSDEAVEGTLMRRIVKDRLIPYESPLYQDGIEQFEQNMRSILKKTRKTGVPVLIGELVSNLKDQTPFDGVDTPESTNAEIAFKAALTAEEQKQYSKAAEQYRKAKELDGIRFRAPGMINEFIHNLEKENDAIAVPIETAFEAASPNGLIGNNLLTDHVHPNIDGCFLMADLFYETMKAKGLIASDWDSTVSTSPWYRNHWPVTALDTMIASLIMRNLKSGWPFRSSDKSDPFLIRFKPGNTIEDLALRVLKEQVEVGKAHLILASQYEAAGAMQLANREYDVLTHLVFIEAYHYLWRAEAFLRRGQKPEALTMLDSSLKLENIPQARRLYEQVSKKLNIN